MKLVRCHHQFGRAKKPMFMTDVCLIYKQCLSKFIHLQVPSHHPTHNHVDMIHHWDFWPKSSLAYYDLALMANWIWIVLQHSSKCKKDASTISQMSWKAYGLLKRIQRIMCDGCKYINLYRHLYYPPSRVYVHMYCCSRLIHPAADIVMRQHHHHHHHHYHHHQRLLSTHLPPLHLTSSHHPD